MLHRRSRAERLPCKVSRVLQRGVQNAAQHTAPLCRRQPDGAQHRRLGLGIALGIGIQLALGRGSDAAATALDWMSIVGQGYIALLKMLVMPLVFVAIVGAFTRTKVTENLGRISAVVLAVLLVTFCAPPVGGGGYAPT